MQGDEIRVSGEGLHAAAGELRPAAQPRECCSERDCWEIAGHAGAGWCEGDAERVEQHGGVRTPPGGTLRAQMAAGLPGWTSDRGHSHIECLCFCI